MASTEFQVVSWQPLDVISQDKLSAMVNNDNWLRDNTVRARYSGNGVKKDTGIRILTGLVLITSGKSASPQPKTVGFDNYFSQSCTPIVTTGIISSAQRQIFVTIDGPGSALQPTRSGFNVNVYVNSTNKKKKISKNFYVSWHAIGF